MSVEANKALARKAIGMWSSGDFAAAAEVYAPGYVNHQHSHPAAWRLHGAEAMARFAAEFRAAFPDFRDTVEDQIAEGDRVVTRFTSRGTHEGRFLGIEPTRREAVWTGVTIDRVEGGKIVESWANWDMLGMLEQLGAVSLLGRARAAGGA